jgi:hypothetical protein
MYGVISEKYLKFTSSKEQIYINNQNISIILILAVNIRN